jgi:acyl-CoA thioester hydrolase
MSKPFRYFLRVRYGECDAQKIVFNARYGDYIDLASVEFFRAAGYSLAEGEFDFQVVKQTVQWKAPARFDQVLELSVTTTAVGNTSFTVATEFRVASDERVIVTAETVYVLVDAASVQKIPVSPSMKESLLRGAPGVTIDHAGHQARAAYIG